MLLPQVLDTVKVPVPGKETPVEPAHLVVLAICVVVAALRSAHFVAHLEHRGTYRNQQNDKEVLDLAPAQSLDGGIVDRALDPAVPGQVVVRPVPLPFSISFVVLFIVRNQIIQREAIMASHEIDALLGLAFPVPEDVRAAQHPLRQ